MVVIKPLVIQDKIRSSLCLHFIYHRKHSINTENGIHYSCSYARIYQTTPLIWYIRGVYVSLQLTMYMEI